MHTALKNKTALVTGVSSGIGRKSRSCSPNGRSCFRHGAQSEVGQPNSGVEIIGMDVTDDASVPRRSKASSRKLALSISWSTMPDTVLPERVEETSLTEARQQFETNFFGILRVTSAVLPGMRQAGFGRLANISSVVGIFPSPFMAMYAASKHAVEGYTESLDHEVRRFGVRALLIEPAFTKSNISHSGKEAEIQLNEYAHAPPTDFAGS